MGLNRAGPPDFLKNLGVTETMFLTNPNSGSAGSWLVESWSLSADLTRATLQFTSSAEFRRWNNGAEESYGQMTAEDVAWSMNDANAAKTPTSAHSQAEKFSALSEGWEAIDEKTLIFNFSSFGFNWRDLLAEGRPSFSVFSLSAFNERGEDFSRNNIVGTGPYLVEEWIADERIKLKRRIFSQ